MLNIANRGQVNAKTFPHERKKRVGNLFQLGGMYTFWGAGMSLPLRTQAEGPSIAWILRAHWKQRAGADELLFSRTQADRGLQAFMAGQTYSSLGKEPCKVGVYQAWFKMLERPCMFERPESHWEQQSWVASYFLRGPVVKPIEVREEVMENI